jgi:hypothetical protein
MMIWGLEQVVDEIWNQWVLVGPGVRMPLEDNPCCWMVQGSGWPNDNPWMGTGQKKNVVYWLMMAPVDMRQKV